MKSRGERSSLTRRKFLTYLGVGAGVGAGIGTGVIAWKTWPFPSGAQGRASFPRAIPTGHVQEYMLEAHATQLTLNGNTVSTWAYNNQVSGPELRLKEGDTLRVIVKNSLPEDTSIHWHGVPLMNKMDGVPGITQKPIQPGQPFTYEFMAPTAGTFFYHSHVGLQLDRGLYGPLIVEAQKEALHYDQEYVLVLDDWLDGMPTDPGNPQAALKQLIAGGDRMGGMGGNNGNMGGMGGMSMQEVPPDLTYPLYLINGKSSDAPFEMSVRKGQRVRLRMINASAATIYHIALQGHRLQVTHTDGQSVEPVTVDALRIGMGERYDVLVDADTAGVWQFAAKVEGAKSMVRAILRYQGSSTSVPPASYLPQEMNRQMLTYSMLKAAPGVYTPPNDQPDQTLPLQLSGGMGQYVWKMNNQIAEKASPIKVEANKLIRFQFENQSMMPHPMHLHGHFFQVDNGTGRGPLKDTVLVDAMQKVTVNWVSDNPGSWAFHCHNLYHQQMGMMQTVIVQ